MSLKNQKYSDTKITTSKALFLDTKNEITYFIKGRLNPKKNSCLMQIKFLKVTGM